MANEELSVDDQISSAFAEFAGEPAAAAGTKTPEEIAAETAAATAASAATKTPEEIAAETEAARVAAEAAASTKTPEEIAAEAEATRVAAEAAAAETAAAALKQTPAEDPKIADLQRQLEELRAAQPKPAAEAPVDIYTADEKTVLAKYKEDWPDIAAAEALARRAESRELVSYVFQQVESKYAPALEYVNNRSGHDQYSDIVALVPDYDAVRDKTLAWVATQPDWLKAAYTKVAEDGTPAEVAGLINLYKKENNIAAPAPTPTPAPVPAAPVVAAITPAAKAAAAKLTVVKSGRSEAGTATEDPCDSAFAGYAEVEEKRLSRK